MPDEPVAESSPAGTTDAAAPEPVEAETAAQEPQQAGESAAPESSESAQADESEAGSEPAKRSEESRGAERRIKQLTAQVRHLERQMRQPQQQAEQRMLQPPVRPKLEQFDDVEAYNQALDKYETDAKTFAVQQDRLEQSRRAAAEQQKKIETELLQSWNKRAERILKVNPDFDTAAAVARVEPSPVMDGFLLDSEVGPEVLSYLDENPDEADRIRDMSPFRAARELYHLEEKFLLEIKGIKSKPVPVKPIGQPAGRAASPAAPKTAADVLYG